MLRAYKTELNPTQKQQSKIHQTIGVCRYIYNFYLTWREDPHPIRWGMNRRHLP